MIKRDELINNIKIIESFSKWLNEKSIYEDYDYCTLDDLIDDDSDDEEGETLTDRLERIIRNMEKELKVYNQELLEKYKNRI